MPITQDRLAAVLASASDYANALDKLLITIERVHKAFFEGTLTEAEAISQITSMANKYALLDNPTTSEVVLAVENHHYSTHRQGNARAAERQRLKRTGSLATSVPTAPRSLLIGRAADDSMRQAQAQYLATRKVIEGKNIIRTTRGGQAQPTEAELDEAAKTILDSTPVEQRIEFQQLADKLEPRTSASLPISGGKHPTAKDHRENIALADALGMELRPDNPADDNNPDEMPPLPPDTPAAGQGVKER